MSRAIQLAMKESEALAHCLAAKVGVSAIEALPGGGVRLVCNSVDGADLIRRKFKQKIIGTERARERHRPVRPLW
jgi:hypothetical protein